jgi:hypothetical protein
VRGPKPAINWTAIKENFTYHDHFQITTLANSEGSFRFQFFSPEKDGEMISHTDSRFTGKALLIALSTSGCPNSHDSADMLVSLYREYQTQGLEIVFVNYELTEDENKIKERIQRFRKEHEITSPILYSRAMNKKEASAELPDLNRVYAWPTVIFRGADGKVKAIHTGIDGPATGIHYEKLVKKYREIIEKQMLPAIPGEN